MHSEFSKQRIRNVHTDSDIWKLIEKRIQMKLLGLKTPLLSPLRIRNPIHNPLDAKTYTYLFSTLNFASLSSFTSISSS